MPAPDATKPHMPSPAHTMFLNAMTGADQRPAIQADVHALTEQVAELVRLLQPPSAVILTGAEVARQFARLTSATA